MRDRAGALLLCCLLTVPLVSAAEGEGSFIIESRLTATAGATLEPTSVFGYGLPFVVFAGDTNDATGMQGEVPSGSVCTYQKKFFTLGAAGVPGTDVQTGYQERCWSLAEASIRLRPGGEHSGFLGFYPSAGTVLTASFSTPAASEIRAASSIGSAQAQTSNSPTFSDYYQEVSGPHLLTVGAGTVEVRGRVGIKIAGLDLEIQTLKNTTHHETGERQDSSAETVITWVYLELDEGSTLTLSIPGRFEIATPDALLTGKGSLHFTPVSGDLRTRQGIYTARNEPSSLEGRFQAMLTPYAGGRTARLEVSGDLRPSASFVVQPAPSRLGEDLPAWASVLLGVALVSMGAGAVVLGQRRRRVRPTRRSTGPETEADLARWRRETDYENHLLSVRAGQVEATPEGAVQYARAASVAEAEQNWLAAYDLIRAARRGAPSDPELVMREGMFLFFMGEKRKAYAAFEDASFLTNDSEPHLWAAQCLVHLHMYERAEHHIAEALQREPHLLEVVEVLPDLQVLRGRRVFEQARVIARASLSERATEAAKEGRWFTWRRGR